MHAACREHVTRNGNLMRPKGGSKSINSSPAIMPLAALYLGVHFFGGIFPSKIVRFAPLLATIQALSKTRVFLHT
jgi:hypothetical protein